ncbi:MAG: DUF309 domain-containing protein [Anaerolineae bacterium]|nr:DUF309 domain-containing protein [Anaerolineae bacterium]
MTKPIVIIADSPLWLESARATLEGADCCVIHQPTRVGYMQTLIDSLAALVLVDSALPAWEAWVHTPKASPSTRRVPIVVLADDYGVRERAFIEGADAALPTSQALDDLASLIQRYARLPNAASLAELNCECAQALPPHAQEGLKYFNRGEYYRQHDLFEAEWAETPGPVRNLYRAILQIGVAYYQIERGNYRGALKMFQRSVQWLMILPDICQGVDVAQLRADAQAAYAELLRVGERGISHFDRRLLRPVRWHNPASP